MVDVQMRRRVERLLAGDMNPDHLNRLFLFARDRCDGRETVREIGDFVAHHNERTKGLLTKTAKKTFLVARIKCEYLNKQFDLRDLPDNFGLFLRYSLDLLDEKTIQNSTKEKKQKLKRH